MLDHRPDNSIQTDFESVAELVIIKKREQEELCKRWQKKKKKNLQNIRWKKKEIQIKDICSATFMKTHRDNLF